METRDEKPVEEQIAKGNPHRKWPVLPALAKVWDEGAAFVMEEVTAGGRPLGELAKLAEAMSGNKVYEAVKAILESEVADFTLDFGRSKAAGRPIRSSNTYAVIPAVRIHAVAQAVHVELVQKPQLESAGVKRIRPKRILKSPPKPRPPART
ncbi:hypothetical protein LCGC14_3010900 [marine sediment metagenome]|uniref:Uncharacterized protein n=1 Tax=marine sediment metagenome TaxID=412755 RepID=A0A0F8WY45_9ZZZZ